MAVIEAGIESNGWVLALRGDWPASDFADFALDPDGAARVRLDVLTAGFDRIDGRAVFNPARARSPVVATTPLRQPWKTGDGTGAAFKPVLSESANGDGTRTVRLALSDRIYAGDQVAVRLSGGWRGGESGLTLVAVNQSERAAPWPIVRWAQPSCEPPQPTSLRRVELVIAAHHPEHHGAELHQAVAGVRFTATDGVNRVEGWASGLSTSQAYGDGLRCWGTELDLSLLNPGTVTVHYEVYPWVGAVRSSGSAHVVDARAGMQIAPDQPIHLYHDPDGSRFPKRFVVVDAATGVTDPTQVTVGASLAAARAGTRAATGSVALQAMSLAGGALPAANGFPAKTRATDWWEIILLAGVQSWGTQLVTTNTGATEGRLIVRGDPGDPDPRANCIWRSMAAAPSGARNLRWWVQDLTLEAGEAVLMQTGHHAHFDNVTVRGKPGFATATSGVFSQSAPAGFHMLSMTRVQWSGYGSGISGSSQRAGLLRNCDHSRLSEAIVHISSRKADDPTFAGEHTSFGFWGQTSDYMLWNCLALKGNGPLTSTNEAFGSSTDPANPATTLRLAIVNTLAERSGTSTARFWRAGEGNYTQLRDCVFEGMTTVGNAINLHNDSSLPKVDLKHQGNVFRNCWMDRNATKHDVYSSDGTLTGSWEILYGVGHEGVCNNNRIWSEASNFQREFSGLRAAVDTSFAGYRSNGWARFVDDRSVFGELQTLSGSSPAATAGNGDYRPDLGSPARRLGRVASVDVDLLGRARGQVFASGAAEPEKADVLALSGADATHHCTAEVARLWERPRLVAGPAMMTMRGGEAAVRVMQEALNGWKRGARTLWVQPEQRSLRAGED